LEDFSLSGFDILLVEDEPLIMFDITCALEDAGARVHCARRLSDAISLLGTMRISAAILDYVLSDGTADDLCEELRRRKIPFSIYSGYNSLHGTCSGEAILSKPSCAGDLMNMVRSLCLGSGRSSRPSSR
jgi:DNA-binding response OmpR family regulator